MKLVVFWLCLIALCSARGSSLGSQVRDGIKLYKEGKGLYKKAKGMFDDAKFTYNAYEHCRAGGAGGYKWCLGEPPLKCCYTENSGGCHSAFNTDAPINCEGNPAYGPTSTAGLCLAPCPGCPGCLCDYIPKCHYGELPKSKKREETTSVNHVQLGRTLTDPQFNTSIPMKADQFFLYGRRGNFIEGFAAEFAKYLSANYKQEGREELTNPITDFLQFRGCERWTQTLDEITLPEWEVVFSPKVNQTTDPFAHAYSYVRTVQYLALARAVNGIPNFWARYDFSHSYAFSKADKATYLKPVSDPEAELAKYLSNTTIATLKKTLPYTWELLSVPLANETAAPVNNFDGCVLGRPSEIAVNFTDGKGQVTIDTLINYPNPPVNGSWHSVKIDWGDNFVEKTFLETSKFTRFQHIYPKPGKYLIVVQAMNSAGLYSIARKTVTVTMGFGIVGKPTLAGITRVVLNITAQGNNRGGGAGTLVSAFHVADAEDSNDFVTLGTASMKTLAQDGPWVDTFVNFQVEFPWTHATPLSKLQVTCRALYNYLYTRGSLRFESITLHTYNSEGTDERQVPVKITNVTGANKDQQGRYALWCARRGDVYEDDAQTIVIEWEPITVEAGVPSNLPEVSELLKEERPQHFSKWKLY